MKETIYEMRIKDNYDKMELIFIPSSIVKETPKYIIIERKICNVGFIEKVKKSNMKIYDNYYVYSIEEGFHKAKEILQTRLYNNESMIETMQKQNYKIEDMINRIEKNQGRWKNERQREDYRNNKEKRDL